MLSGIDPEQAKQDRKEEKQKRELEEQAKTPTGRTFKEVALAWADFKAKPKTKRNWKLSHKKAVISSLSREVFPLFGDRIIHTLVSADVDAVIDPIQGKGALEVSERTLHRISAIFRYGMFKQWCDSNPAIGRGEFLERHELQRMKHIEEKDLPKFIHDLENYQGNFVCKSAIQFVLLTYARTNDEWSEIDYEAKQWNIPAERMKMGISQTIPLCTQAIELLESIKPITGSSNFIFASMIAMQKPISANGMLSALYNMGYKGKTTIHGLRGTYSTIAK